MTNKRGEHGTMADRIAATQANRGHSTVNRPPSNEASGPGTDYGETADYRQGDPQHVWVTGEYGRGPGLLLEWRKPAQLPWEGHVVHYSHVGGRSVLVDQWLPAGAITPAG